MRARPRLPNCRRGTERSVTGGWNGGVHDLIALQANAHAGGGGARRRGRVVTYAELRAGIVRFSGTSRRHGVRPATRRCRARSLLRLGGESCSPFSKSGAAFVPLDADWPPARMLSSDAGCRREMRDRDGGSGRRVVPTRGCSIWWSRGRTADPAADLERSPDARRTSSTRPAAREAERGRHRARPLANHARAAIERFGLTDADRVLQFAPLSFESVSKRSCPTLVAGGTVVFRPGSVVPSCRELVSFMTSPA